MNTSPAQPFDQAEAGRQSPSGIAGSFAVSPPSIALPKGGGAIRGISEKFGVNAVIGTGSLSVAIATSPGRQGFGPQLKLSYDSGAGNGVCGFGWTLGQPAITRKTEKRLPQYRDAENSDVFILSGAEDLSPVLKSDNDGNWMRDENGNLIVDDQNRDGYTVRRFQPRIEGIYARIERWTRDSDCDVHWRLISKDNVLTIYGQDASSRIVDPENPDRVFSWLICETRDDRGNAIVYEYKPDDGAGVDLSKAHEALRGDDAALGRRVNRYLKRVRYGNRVPLLDDQGRRPRFLSAGQFENAGWMFEIVLDYGDHNPDFPKPRDDEERNEAGALKYPWGYRCDAFSTYRAGFEVRTTRLCQRVLMFHHFPDEEGVGRDCLVRSTDFTYSYETVSSGVDKPVYSFLVSATQKGYKRSGAGEYRVSSLPPVEFEYSRPTVRDRLDELDTESVAELGSGWSGGSFQWADLHGEGIVGILTEQAGTLFYKRNLSPLFQTRENGTPVTKAKFAPLEHVPLRPNLALAGGAQLMDLAGDGQPDVVVHDGPMPGLYEHDGAEGWQPFRPFTSRLNRDTRDPHLRFIDLDGDGRPDVLVMHDDAFVWHASLGEAGYGTANRVAHALDENHGPRLVFADGGESIYLADMSGDGLTDLVRVRNGEVCYWPNLGYGRFGAKVTMDEAPQFDDPDRFDHGRIRLADIDGTGTTDIIYLHSDGVRLYFNQSGNRWSAPQMLRVFPRVDDLVDIVPLDLLGNGTACLVWTSSFPGDTTRPVRYVDLMGGQKPHVLIRTLNNLGTETKVLYAPSTRFHLRDKQDGKPWITRLPFPVHVVERIETYDHVSRNRFVTRYAYHHGYFDAEEREFRGFGMVEQWDTEEIHALGSGALSPIATNEEVASQVPPIHSKTWFHTGVFLNREDISGRFEDEYYREPGLGHEELRGRLLADTVLPAGLTLEEKRQACRGLKGMMLRQEIYADDAPPGSSEAIIARARIPYTVVEQNFTVRIVQPHAAGSYAVVLTHPREVLCCKFERTPTDPRIRHALVLDVDNFGNVLKEANIAYGRRNPDATLPLGSDRDQQTQTLITYGEHRVTRPIGHLATDPDQYRAPLPCETRRYELTGLKPRNDRPLFSFEEWTEDGFALPASATEIAYEQAGDNATRQKRLIEHLRTLYRKDDLTALLPLGELEPLALSGEKYRLAFTPGLLINVFNRNGQPLLPDAAAVLGGSGRDQGGFINSQALRNENLFPADAAHPLWTSSDANDYWWMPAGRTFLSPDSAHNSAAERHYAERHFFLTLRYRDAFHAESAVTYDAYDLLMVDSRDAVGNRVTVGERLPDGTLNLATPGNDYRLLQPKRVMEANGNRMQVAFDTLGMVVGTAIMGKPPHAPMEGDSLHEFEADLSEAEILDHIANPLADPGAILRRATTRLVYDLFGYRRTMDHPEPQPAVVYTLSREMHDADLAPGQHSKVQHRLSYFDGFGREIQRKIQAEPGSVPQRNAQGKIIVGPDGQPKMTNFSVSPRWLGSGWTIFNNKGKPVRQFEPFFTDTHRFEFDVRIGVSLVLFYDPVERVVTTLHPHDCYEKIVFDPWQQTTYDLNDTVSERGAEKGDPRTDRHIASYVIAYFKSQPAEWKTWHNQRHGGLLGQPEQAAAAKAAAHADTPTTVHLDALGRPFLTVAHNRVACPNHDLDNTEETYCSRVDLDIEGHQRVVRDAMIQNGDPQGRMVTRYDFDLLGNRIHQASMEAGDRWVVNDVTGNPIRSWDSRGHGVRIEYDPLRRPLRSFVVGADSIDPNHELLVERLVYGEQHPENEQRNLRTRLYLHLDQAGAAAGERFNFKGRTLTATRRIAVDYKQPIDWSAVDAALPADSTIPFDTAALEAALIPLLDPGAYASTTTYDALNRPLTSTTPHTAGMQPSVIRHTYNEANLLERLDVNLRGAALAGEPVWTTFINNIDYNAKGQRIRVEYGNGATTAYEYDPQTFRLVRLLTRRNTVAFPEDCTPAPPAGWPGCHVQDLHYTYDPVGNITQIVDSAQQTIYFRNKRVEPSADYTYDALYRLIAATGREHLGQLGGAPIPHSHSDAPRVGVAGSPSDGNLMGAYIERYVYDAVGNFLRMQHIGSDPAHPGFSRSYDYDEPSLIEPAKRSNRLSRTALGDGNGLSEHYVYDAHGNTTRMPHLGGAHPDPNIVWDYRDQQHRVDLGGGGVAYYAYNAGGQRVRKVWEKSVSLVEERLYLGGFEIWRRRNGAGDLLVERETLHVMDEEQRIALVETRTVAAPDADVGPPQLIRYQVSNHLGSASLELDDQARVISYEEWTPYGSTSYQAVRSQTETAKRYRFTGKERDEESGLYYHGARYYAPWLGRWTACDRVGTRAGPNLYRFVDDNPVKLVDPSGLWPEFVDNLGASLGRAVDRIADDPLSAAGGAALAVLDNATMGAGTLVNDFIQGEQGATARGIGSNPAAAEAYTIVSIAQPLIEVGIGGTILIGGGGGGAAATAGTGGLGAPVTVPVAVGSTVVGAVLIAHGGLSLMTAIPRVQAVRAHMSSMDDSAGGGGYDPRRSQQQAKARDRAKSREATLQDRAEQAEGLPSTREGAEDLDRLEDVYGPEARDHLAEHGEMPEGAPVQNHHPERIADAPEQARRGGRLLDPRAHHRGAHQNRTNRPTEPGAPIEPPEGGYGVRDTDRSTRGRQTGQMTEEELDAEMYRQGRYGPALDE